MLNGVQHPYMEGWVRQLQEVVLSVQKTHHWTPTLRLETGHHFITPVFSAFPCVVHFPGLSGISVGLKVLAGVFSSLHDSESDTVA